MNENKEKKYSLIKLLEGVYYVTAIIGIVFTACSYNQSVKNTNQEYKPTLEVMINQKSITDDFIIFCSDNLKANNTVPTLKITLTNKGKGLAKNIKLSIPQSAMTRYLGELKRNKKEEYSKFSNEDFEVDIPNYLSESESVTIDVPEKILGIFYDIYCMKAEKANYIFKNYEKIADQSLDIPIKIECCDNQEQTIKYNIILRVSVETYEETMINAGPGKQRILSIKYKICIKE